MPARVGERPARPVLPPAAPPATARADEPAPGSALVTPRVSEAPAVETGGTAPAGAAAEDQADGHVPLYQVPIAPGAVDSTEFAAVMSDPRAPLMAASAAIPTGSTEPAHASARHDTTLDVTAEAAGETALDPALDPALDALDPALETTTLDARPDAPLDPTLESPLDATVDVGPDPVWADEIVPASELESRASDLRGIGEAIDMVLESPKGGAVAAGEGKSSLPAWLADLDALPNDSLHQAEEPPAAAEGVSVGDARSTVAGGEATGQPAHAEQVPPQPAASATESGPNFEGWSGPLIAEYAPYVQAPAYEPEVESTPDPIDPPRHVPASLDTAGPPPAAATPAREAQSIPFADEVDAVLDPGVASDIPEFIDGDPGAGADLWAAEWDALDPALPSSELAESAAKPMPEGHDPAPDRARTRGETSPALASISRADAIGSALERLAHRIRAGEIDVSAVAPAGPETAVLASVLAALLAGNAGGAGNT